MKIFAGWIAFAAVLMFPFLKAADNVNADPNAMRIDVNRGAAGLARWLAAINTRASVMAVVAHPDDEDGGMLTYETRGRGARGILLTLTRGEGGQNAMSSDLYDALGLVRTQELLDADRYYGVDQYFANTIDYGFSKTREEALQQWGYDRVLESVVRVVRMTRPLVITSTFAGAPTDGHGQHQVSGQMAQEVFLAAGDPNRFPEQIREGLRPWSPLKVYARVPFFKPTKQGIYDYATDKYGPVRFYDYVHKTWIDHTPASNVEIPEGGLDAAAGLTFLQISRTGWGMQKSQNGGATTPPPTDFASAYHRYGAHVSVPEKENSFFDGIDVSLMGIVDLAKGDTGFLKQGLEKLSRFAREAEDHYSISNPAGIVPVLGDGLKETRSLLQQVEGSELPEPGKDDVAFELRVKEKQFEQALTLALGTTFEVTVAPEHRPSGPFAAFAGPQPTFSIAIPGQTFGVDARVFNPNPNLASIDKVEVIPSDGKNWQIQSKGKDHFSVRVPTDATLTRPYFWRPNQEQPYYNLSAPQYRNLPLPPYPLVASARIHYRDCDWEIKKVVQTVEHVEGVGLEMEPLLVGPAISVAISPQAGAVPLRAKSFTLSCLLHSNVKGKAQGVLRLDLPEGWSSTPKQVSFAFDHDGEDQSLTFQVEPASLKAQSYQLKAVAEYDGKSYEEGYHLAGYPGVRPYPLYRPATYQAVGVNVKTAPALRIGFLPGTGDDVPQALKDLGVNVQTLSIGDLENENLSDYDAIVLGVRAYTAVPKLQWATPRLLSYVKNGGTLLVQYNLGNFGQDSGPYPFDLGSNPQKVVNEDSPVKLLEPHNPLLNWPNKISEDDFKEWQEERGHGFLKTWDPHYQALVETHDAGQDPQKGGLLVAHYGRGTYIYDAFALYRQLPAGVPGAYRILANLISADKNPEWK